MAMKMKSMKKSMKAGMKKKSAMKAGMKRKAMKVSIKGKKWQVFKGTRVKSIGGLTKADLTKNKNGKVVSKKKSALGKKSKWMTAVASARKSLGIKGFQAVGGKTAKGQALLKKVRSLYKK